jgi:hypothetical protein
MVLQTLGFFNRRAMPVRDLGSHASATGLPHSGNSHRRVYGRPIRRLATLDVVINERSPPEDDAETAPG